MSIFSGLFRTRDAPTNRTSGSTAAHKCVFHIKPKEGVSVEDLELEMIDYRSFPTILRLY